MDSLAPAHSSKSPGARLHIVLLDPVFRPPNVAGDTRSFDVVARMADAGHRVTVMTTSAAAVQLELPDGVDLARIRVQELERFGHAITPAGYRRFAWSAAWRIWAIADVDAVVALDRPVGLLPWLWLFCLVRGIPLILDARAGLPAAPTGRDVAGQRIAAWTARLSYRFAARFAGSIVALNRRTAETLAPSAKIVVSTPGCDTTLFANLGEDAPLAATYPQLGPQPFLLYAGGLRTELTFMVDVTAALASTPLVICGDGPARALLEARARDRGILNTHIMFLDPIARRRLPGLLRQAGAIVATGPLQHFYDGLAASKPMIVIGEGPERELVESRRAGIGISPRDPAAAVRDVADFMSDADGLRRAGEQAAALAAGRFNLERVAMEYRNTIEEAVAADPRSAVMRRRTLRAKRFIDIAVSFAGLIILSPVFVVIGAAIVWKMGWPIFFTQQRPGLKGRIFRIIKFRSMTNAAGTTSPDEQRLTPLGRFLRRTSLDELPELINVLFGQMSLVGPRPLLPEYLPYYSAEQRRRHDLRPGLTGWAQVNGRNAQTWDERFKADVWYVDNVGLWLDLKIILKTLWVVLTAEGVNAEGHATMPRFDEIVARSQGAEDV